MAGLDHITFISPAIATEPDQLDPLPTPQGRVLLDKQTLAKTCQTGNVRLAMSGRDRFDAMVTRTGSVTRIAALKLDMDKNDNRILRSGVGIKKSRPSQFRFADITPEPDLTRQGTAIIIPATPSNPVIYSANYVSPEYMHFPGSLKMLPVVVHEAYKVRPQQPWSQARRKTNPPLSTPIHIGTVAAFRGGPEQNLLLYRQLDRGNMPPVTRGRRLLLAVHGSELPDDYVGAPVKTALPPGISFAQTAPSGYLSNRRSLDQTQLRQRQRQNLPSVSMTVLRQTRKYWPIYVSQKNDEEGHTMRFQARDLGPLAKKHSVAEQLFKRASGLPATPENQGYTRNLRIRNAANRVDGWYRLSDRDDRMVNGLVFCALNNDLASDESPVDIMTPDTDKITYLSDVFDFLRQAGIAGQYSEVLSTSCRRTFDPEHVEGTHVVDAKRWYLTEQYVGNNRDTRLVFDARDNPQPVLLKMDARH